MRGRVVAGAVLCVAVACTGESEEGSPPDRAEARASPGTLTVILVRHTEKGAEPAGDPSLTEAGETRAAALAHALERVPVSAILGTDRRRTQETLAPLAAQHDLPVGRIGMDDIEGMVEAIRSQAGGVVVVAAHNHTSHFIVEELVGAPAIEPIPDPDYDDLFIIVLERDDERSGWRSREVLSLQYGRPTPTPESS